MYSSELLKDIYIQLSVQLSALLLYIHEGGKEGRGKERRKEEREERKEEGRKSMKLCESEKVGYSSTRVSSLFYYICLLPKSKQQKLILCRLAFRSRGKFLPQGLEAFAIFVKTVL